MSLTYTRLPLSSVVELIGALVSARTDGVRERTVAIVPIAIRASCRRFRIPGQSLAEARDTSTPTFPEPDGEFLNQSNSIIGVGRSGGNLSEGPRTTRVI